MMVLLAADTGSGLRFTWRTLIVTSPRSCCHPNQEHRPNKTAVRFSTQTKGVDPSALLKVTLLMASITITSSRREGDGSEN